MFLFHPFHFFIVRGSKSDLVQTVSCSIILSLLSIFISLCPLSLDSLAFYHNDKRQIADVANMKNNVQVNRDNR